MSPQSLTSTAETSTFDYKLVLHVLLSQRWWIVGITALFALHGLYKAYTAVPIYQVDALIQVEDSKGGVTPMDAMMMQGRASIATEMELLKSRMVLGYAVDALGLDIAVSPRYFPVIGAPMARRHHGNVPARAPWWAGSGYAWGGQSLVVTRFEADGDWKDKSLTLIAGEPGRYMLKVSDGKVLQGGRVGEQSIWHVGDATLALFVRELEALPGTEFSVWRMKRVDAINSLAGSLQLSERGRNAGMIDLRYDDPDPARALRVLNQIANSYVRQNVERRSAEAQKTLDFLDTQLPVIKQQVEAAELKFNQFRQVNRTLDVNREGDMLLSQSVVAETQIAQLEQRRRELLVRYTAEHPVIRTIDNQIAEARSQLARMTGQADRLPKVQQEFLRLTRDLKVNQELYARMLDNAQQLRVGRAGTVGNVRVVDYAVPAAWPYKPNPTKIFLMNLLAGLGLGLVVAYLITLTRSGVKDAQQIEQQLNLSVLATVPESERQVSLLRKAKAGSGEPGLLAVMDPGDLAIESLRSLRTSLQFVMLDATNRVLMLTGPAPGIGKSFLAVNLGGVLADAGERVLVIDADLRRGHLQDYFGAERAGGLSELIAGRLGMEQACRDSGIANLHYISTGMIPPNPSELLLHPRFMELLTWAEQHYDRIIVDSPPILAVTDAAIIGRHAGAVLMVARFAVTPLKELELATRRLQQAGVTVSGVVLNRIERTTGYSYGYKYQYAYEYQSINNGKQS